MPCHSSLAKVGMSVAVDVFVAVSYTICSALVAVSPLEDSNALAFGMWSLSCDTSAVR